MHPPITITAADAQEAAKDDATPAPIPDVSYALTILRERMAIIDATIREIALTQRQLRGAVPTLENTGDDLRKIERALLGET